MELANKLDALASKIVQQGSVIETEEATKIAFIMPFIQDVLGYDVFDPTEVIPEFTADVGIKRGEKVDYAILKNKEIQILMECKKLGEPLGNHASQLYRYFSVTTARIAVLTNGRVYKFFTDLDSPNKMDEKPFLVLDLCDIDDNVIPELSKLTKPAFDLESVINAAGELKYVSLLKRAINEQFDNPSDELIRFFICRIYDGVITQKVREQFTPLILKAQRQFLSDKVNARLKSAITTVSQGGEEAVVEESQEEVLGEISDKDMVVTSQEEVDGFNIVRAIVRSVVDIRRVAARDTLSYFGVLLDDNNRKPICRMHFNRVQKYIGILDENKAEIRHPIESLDDIFNFSDELKKAALFYN